MEQEMQDQPVVSNEEPQEAAKQEGADLNIQDLVGLRSVIDVATQRGAFKAAEMEAVGKVYNRLSGFIDTVSKAKGQ